MQLSAGETTALAAAVATAGGFLAKYGPGLFRMMTKAPNGNGNGNHLPALTRQEHETICRANMSQVMVELAAIKAHEENAGHRLDQVDQKMDRFDEKLDRIAEKR